MCGGGKKGGTGENKGRRRGGVSIINGFLVINLTIKQRGGLGALAGGIGRKCGKKPCADPRVVVKCPSGLWGGQAVTGDRGKGRKTHDGKIPLCSGRKQSPVSDKERWAEEE